MLHRITAFEEIDGRKLMDLYQEGNEENTGYFYPELTDKALAMQKVETDFLRYIETEFLGKGNGEYWILEEDGVWISALRLYLVREGLYYLEALETHPDFRRQGYGTRLLAGVVEELKREGTFRLCDCVSKKNTASIRTHKKCGFEIVSSAGYDYLQDTTDERDYGMEYTCTSPSCQAQG
ncbi:MAG: GNAT family N-acetyltransferase [Lachnospiraceae bacterium]|jgi:ribosomal protein S18 acetylase RimI-like enzyme|nr:GNAT family N-acetyltransferase [Lachnospiraceae bacterium]